MSRYWVYLNNQVMGPFELEQLIRQPGFSRQTMVSVDDFSGAVGRWISPADIPELARIFQKVDEIHDSPAPGPRPPPKPLKPKMPLKLTPVPPPVEVPQAWYANGWLWFLVILALAGGGVMYWTQHMQRTQQADERQAAQALIETTPLPATSLYSTLRQYLQTKQIATRWEFERLPTGLYNINLSWMPADHSESHLPVYAFEVNLQVESVRGLNTAAAQLLAHGFPRPPDSKVAAPSPPKKSPGDFFPSAINDRRQAYEQGDFDTVWATFSRRRKAEMEQGGISQSGFVRMQKLTYRMSPGLQQNILKTRSDSDAARLVLLRQSQPKHPDIYIKQKWVWEENSWRLDEEDKKTASAPTAVNPASPAPAPLPDVPANLPGLSDSPTAPR